MNDYIVTINDLDEDHRPMTRDEKVTSDGVNLSPAGQLIFFNSPPKLHGAKQDSQLVRGFQSGRWLDFSRVSGEPEQANRILS